MWRRASAALSVEQRQSIYNLLDATTPGCVTGALYLTAGLAETTNNTHWAGVDAGGAEYDCVSLCTEESALQSTFERYRK
jgi:hypothetical protein